jgi:hypothetical protein
MSRGVSEACNISEDDESGGIMELQLLCEHKWDRLLGAFFEASSSSVTEMNTTL